MPSSVHCADRLREFHAWAFGRLRAWLGRLSPCVLRGFALILFSIVHVDSYPRRRACRRFPFSAYLWRLRCRLRRRHWRLVFRCQPRWTARRLDVLLLWLLFLSASFVSTAHGFCSFPLPSKASYKRLDILSRLCYKIGDESEDLHDNRGG